MFVSIYCSETKGNLGMKKIAVCFIVVSLLHEHAVEILEVLKIIQTRYMS